MMKAASIHEIKQELGNLQKTQLEELCVRLSRYKKENKELLSYLLFESFDETAYCANIKREMEIQFALINNANLYFVKKSLRKILRITSKYCRYTSNAETEIKLLIHFCKILQASRIPFRESPVLVNLYNAQLKKINKAIATLHEDLQYDYLQELKKAE